MGIQVFDLKKEIMVNKKLKGLDFDLAIYNAQTNEEYVDDNAIVPRNTSILVNRNPASKPGRGTAQKYLGTAAPFAQTGRGRGQAAAVHAAGYGSGGPRSMSLVNTQSASSTSALDSSQSTSTTEFAAMFANQESQWQQEQEKMSTMRPVARPPPSNFRPRLDAEKGSGIMNSDLMFPARPPPLGYICYRCGQKGHYINVCPTLGDEKFDNKPKIKRTTGIPKIFLKAVDDVHTTDGTVMVTQTGELVVAQTNSVAWSKVSNNARAQGVVGDIYEIAPVLSEFKCPICNKNMKNAVIVPCCSKSFCDECIRESILENENHALRFKCHQCQSGLTPDALKPNADLREAIERHIRNYASAGSNTTSTHASPVPSPSIPLSGNSSPAPGRSKDTGNRSRTNSGAGNFDPTERKSSKSTSSIRSEVEGNSIPVFSSGRDLNQDRISYNQNSYYDPYYEGQYMQNRDYFGYHNSFRPRVPANYSGGYQDYQTGYQGQDRMNGNYGAISHHQYSSSDQYNMGRSSENSREPGYGPRTRPWQDGVKRKREDDPQSKSKK